MLTLILSIIIGIVVSTSIQFFRKKIHLYEFSAVLLIFITIGILLSTVIMVIPRKFTYKYEIYELSSIKNSINNVFIFKTNDLKNEYDYNCIIKNKNGFEIYGFDSNNTKIKKCKIKPIILIKKQHFYKSDWYFDVINDITIENIIYLPKI